MLGQEWREEEALGQQEGQSGNHRWVRSREGRHGLSPLLTGESEGKGSRRVKSEAAGAGSRFSTISAIL